MYRGIGGVFGWIRRGTLLALALGGLAGFSSKAAEAPPARSFAIRGALPWHNFLCGPSVWNEADYRAYLDSLKAQGLNLVVFHNYTGGAQRYHTYVEPMIRIAGFDVLPEATFDTSLTARWGYRPLAVADFAFGTSRLFELPSGAAAFGADCMLNARDNADRYRAAQALMRRVLEMAHSRGIRFAMGFEVGVHPPEYASVVPQDAILQHNGVILKPESPAARLLLRNTIDDLLTAYPGIDQIWLWQQEHSFLAPGDHRWTEAYIRLAYDYLKARAPGVRVVIGGWGNGNQLPETLAHLDKALPSDIVFTCLNPDGGQRPHVAVLDEIAQHREVWAIPWLEHDSSMWHLQLSADKVLENVRRASAGGLQGVIALHWRTEETRAAMAAFAQAAAPPDRIPSLGEFYAADSREQYGAVAGETLAPLLAKMDREGWLAGAASPEFFPYDPFSWGVLRAEQREHIQYALAAVEGAETRASAPEHKFHLGWLRRNLAFFLQLDEVSRKLQPAYRLRDLWLADKISRDQVGTEARAAAQALAEAPLEPLFTTYAQRVRSPGERGVLSSLNQRVWLQYRELDRFLRGLADGE